MRTPDEIAADARPGAPFTTDEELEAWEAAWCYVGCVHEAGCPLLEVVETRQPPVTPSEWALGPRTASPVTTYLCTLFHVPPPDGEGQPG